MMVHLSPPCSSGETSIIIFFLLAVLPIPFSLLLIIALSVQELPGNGNCGLQNPLQTHSIFVP